MKALTACGGGMFFFSQLMFLFMAMEFLTVSVSDFTLAFQIFSGKTTRLRITSIAIIDANETNRTDCH